MNLENLAKTHNAGEETQTKFATATSGGDMGESRVMRTLASPAASLTVHGQGNPRKQ